LPTREVGSEAEGGEPEIGTGDGSLIGLREASAPG